MEAITRLALRIAISIAAGAAIPETLHLVSDPPTNRFFGLISYLPALPGFVGFFLSDGRTWAFFLSTSIFYAVLSFFALSLLPFFRSAKP